MGCNSSLLPQNTQKKPLETQKETIFSKSAETALVSELSLPGANGSFEPFEETGLYSFLCVLCVLWKKAVLDSSMWSLFVLQDGGDVAEKGVGDAGHALVSRMPVDAAVGEMTLALRAVAGVGHQVGDADEVGARAFAGRLDPRAEVIVAPRAYAEDALRRIPRKEIL